MKSVTKVLLALLGSAWAFVLTPTGSDLLSKVVLPLIAAHPKVGISLGAISAILGILHIPQKSLQ